MKVLVAFSLFVVVALAAPEGDFYDPKYDNFDVDTIIENSRLMKGYANCFLGKGNCTPEGTTFKKMLPEALESGCVKCSPKQRAIIRKVIRAVQQQLPEEFAELRKIYDPENKYVEGVKKFLAEEN